MRVTYCAILFSNSGFVKYTIIPATIPMIAVTIPVSIKMIESTTKKRKILTSVFATLSPYSFLKT